MCVLWGESQVVMEGIDLQAARDQATWLPYRLTPRLSNVHHIYGNNREGFFESC